MAARILSQPRRGTVTVAPAADELRRTGTVLQAVGKRHRWMRRFTLGGLLWAVAVAVLVPTNANAATVRRAYGSLWFTAAQGEQNQVTAHVVHPRLSRRPDEWTIRDAGAQLKPRRGCAAVDEHTVRCSIGSPEAFRVDLGELDDALQFTELRGDRRHRVFLHVDAGPGNDRVAGSSPYFAALYGQRGDDFLHAAGRRVRLEGGRDNDRLYGGAGNDVLVASRGVDYLDGRAGDDGLFNEHWYSRRRNVAVEPDVFVGGAGSDLVSYEQRSAPVLVDLEHPDRGAGEVGEGDRLIAIEEVAAGTGDDVLAGDDGPNKFYDQRGRDRVVGRGGDDWFYLGQGRRKVGDDKTVSCGTGHDLIAGRVRVSDFLQPGCEIIYAPLEQWRISANPVTVRGKRLDYKLRCPTSREVWEPFDPAPCSGVIRLETALSGRLLALARFSRGKWRNHTVTAELTPLGELLAQRPNGVKAHTVLRVRVRQPSETQIMRWTVRLNVPR